jgi:fumarate hydratase subunit alpha
MRIVEARYIKEAVAALVVRANTHLRGDILRLLKNALEREKNRLARKALAAIIENAALAKKKNLAICQDTGFPVIFLELGCNVFVKGNITTIIMDAVAQGYRQGYLRASVQKDPVLRNQPLAHSPVIVHTDIVKGDKIVITLMPKGFGSENKSLSVMLNPTAAMSEIEDFVVSAVERAGASACPPYVIGVGIGGTQDYAGLLAKKALAGSLNSRNRRKELVLLEQRLLERINKLKIGACGFGGSHTALAVKVKTYPTHIAGLPVSVNISCHALRSARISL